MEFGIVPLSGRPSEVLRISETEFVAIRTARGQYLALLDIEEKFDIAIESYFDYERTRLDLALHQMTRVQLLHPALAADVRVVNRKLLNLLAAGMLYDDQLAHGFCVLYGRNSPKWSRVEEKRTSLRASSLGYQVAEVVRDHIQHRGLPVNALFYQLTAKEAAGERRIQVATDPHLAVNQLQDDRRIPKELITKLRKLGDRVSLTPLIKEYVGCLGDLHIAVRDETATDGEAWVNELRAALQRAQEKFVTARVVAAVTLAEDGSRGESHQVFEDLLALREALLHKNAFLSKLSQRFVTAEQP
jgi:hypothetical protein